MKKGRKLTIALDWDNVLAPCTELACQKMTQRGTPVDVSEVTLYSFANFPKELADGLMAIFKEPDFYDGQGLYPGAAEMVEELLAAGHEVVIASAMPPEQMGIRGKQICALLPGIKESNVMLGSRKDLLHVDFLLDDAVSNISSSPAKYPVIFTRPWNRSEEGFLRAADYQEFIKLVEAVSLAPAADGPKLGAAGHPGMICLVGPSASGKSFICDELVRNPLFRKVKALTTRQPRPDGADAEEYHFVTEREFEDAAMAGSLVEQTVYAGARYAIARGEVESIWAEGRIAIKPVDIHGATACKAAFGDQCVSVFVRRSKEEIISALLERDIPNEDKTRRLMTLDQEMENERLCDWTVSNNGSLDHAIRQIMRIIG